jgi:hypothetical protein
MDRAYKVFMYRLYLAYLNYMCRAVPGAALLHLLGQAEPFHMINMLGIDKEEDQDGLIDADDRLILILKCFIHR